MHGELSSIRAYQEVLIPETTWHNTAWSFHPENYLAISVHDLVVWNPETLAVQHQHKVNINTLTQHNTSYVPIQAIAVHVHEYSNKISIYL